MHPYYAFILDNIGTTYSKKGYYNKALIYYLKSIKIIKNVFGEISFKCARTLNNIGNTYSLKGDYNKGLEYQLKSMKIIKNVLR